MSDADTIKLAFELMGRALEDSTLDTWEDRVAAYTAIRRIQRLVMTKQKESSLKKFSDPVLTKSK
eukprot:5300595-Ditylum_brightwellii.AAC.1